jgi:multisubunit Na+/H+ antiporter MnhG subunit
MVSSPSRPLSTRELLERAGRIYARHFFLVVGISAIPYLCCLAVNLSFSSGLEKAVDLIGAWMSFLLTFLARVHRRYPSIPMGVLRATYAAAIIPIATLVGLIPLFLKFLSGAVVTAATSVGISSIYSGQETSVTQCYAGLKGKFGRIVYVFLAVLLRTLVGLVLFIIPGVYWGARDSLAISAVALEDIKGKQARARSAALTRGAIRRILIIYFVFAVLEYAITRVLRTVLVFIYHSSGRLFDNTAAWIWTAFVLVLTTPFIAIALALAYYDQRVRLEEFDVENMISKAQEALPIPSLVVTP